MRSGRMTACAPGTGARSSWTDSGRISRRSSNSLSLSGLASNASQSAANAASIWRYGWPSRQNTNALGSRKDAPSRPSGPAPTPRALGWRLSGAGGSVVATSRFRVVRAPDGPDRSADLGAQEDRDGDDRGDHRLDDE